MPLVRALNRLLAWRASPWALAWCRIGVGVAALGRGVKSIRDLYLLQHDPGAVPARLFEWAPELASTAEIALFGVAWVGASAGLIAGWHPRISAAALAALTAFLHIVDQNFWGHHVYFLFLVLVLLSVAETGAVLSPRWWRDDRAEPTVAYWPAWLLKVQLSLVYFYSAVAKIHPLYLEGDVLLNRLALPDILRRSPWIETLSAATIGVEFFLLFALWVPALRRSAVWIGIGFHGVIPFVMGPYAGLLVFSLTVLSLYPLYFDKPLDPQAALSKSR